MRRVQIPVVVVAVVAVALVLHAAAGANAASGPSLEDPLRNFRYNGQTLSAAQLPRGRVELAGAAWDVDLSRAVVLRGDEEEPLRPLSAPDGMRGTHLAFLHTYQPGEALEDHRAAVALAKRQLELPPGPPTVMTYEVEYADGEVIEAPVRRGRGIHQWYRVHAVPPMIWAREAWTKDIDPGSGEKVAVHAMKWPNPRPDKLIRQVRVRPNDDRYNDYGDALILAVSATREPAQGRTYHVDPHPFASDEGPGSFDQPWASLQHAVDSMRAGDTVYLRGGYYALDRPVAVPDYAGEDGEWFTISAYPGQTPVLDGFGALYNPRLRPYDPEAAPAGPYQHDRGIIDVRHFPGWLRIQGLRIQRSQRAGISVHATAGAPRGTERPRFLEVAFNTTYLCDTMGTITHHVDDVRVIGNRIVRPHSPRMAFSVAEGEPIARTQHAQEGIDMSRNTRFEVAYNKVIGAGKEAIDIISCTDGRTHHDYIDSALNGIYIDSWTIPIERMEVNHNFIVNAFVGIPCANEGGTGQTDFKIHHNIVVDSKSTAIGVSQIRPREGSPPYQGHRIYNNTIHRPGHHATAICAGVGANPDGTIDRSGSADIGALPHGTAWLAGMDWAGHATRYHSGRTEWRPLTIPRRRFTMHRNHLERPSWFQRGRYGPDLRHLPAGEHCWEGITWFIEEDHRNSGPTMLALAGFATEADAESITGIPVGRRADSLAFLQTAHVQDLEDGDEVFHYGVHYADGSSAKAPVLLNEHIGGWWGGAEDLPEAELAWALPVKIRSGGWRHERLFAFVWENPRPDDEIASIDMLRAAPKENGTAAVLAISIGHR